MTHHAVWLLLTDVSEERAMLVFRIKDIGYKFVVCSFSAMIGNCGMRIP
jgi:hypothetical protein